MRHPSTDSSKHLPNPSVAMSVAPSNLSRLRRENLKTEVSAVTTHQMFSVHITPEKHKNVTIT